MTSVMDSLVIRGSRPSTSKSTSTRNTQVANGDTSHGHLPISSTAVDESKVKDTPREPHDSNIKVTFKKTADKLKQVKNESQLQKKQPFKERAFVQCPVLVKDSHFVVRGRPLQPGVLDDQGFVQPTKSNSEPSMYEARSVRSSRSMKPEWDDRGLRLPALMFGGEEVVSVGHHALNGRPIEDYHVCGNAEAWADPTEQMSSRLAVYDEPEVLLSQMRLRRLLSNKRSLTYQGSTGQGQQDNLEKCLNVNQACGLKPAIPAPDVSVKLKHHTQYMNKHQLQKHTNPFKNLKQGYHPVTKTDQVIRHEFNTLQSYLLFNQQNENPQGRRYMAGVLRVAKNRPTLQRSHTDPTLGRISTQDSLRDLQDFVQVKTPRFDLRNKKLPKQEAVER